MGAPKHQLSLRELGRLEGGCNGDVGLFIERLGVPVDAMSPRQRAAYDVITGYRPARVLLRSENSDQQAQGREGMLLFADTRISIADAAINAGDLIGGLNTLQQRASGLGMAGERDSQVLVLRQAWETLNRDFTLDDSSDDVLFLRDSLFAGLYENDPEFKHTVSLDALEKFVLGMHKQQDPNFAGRAIVLARRFVNQGYPGKAVLFLEMAIESHLFSKEDQVNDARTYRDQLIPTDRLIHV